VYEGLKGLKCGVRARACLGDGCGVAVDFIKLGFVFLPNRLANTVPQKGCRAANLSLCTLRNDL
jgi:hypothetical protein